MRGWLQFLYVSLVGIVLVGLTGCEAQMRVVASSSNPGEIGTAVIGIFVIWVVALVIFSDSGIASSMIYGARYTGVLTLILTPFQFAAGNISMAIALLAFGAIGILLPNIMAFTKPKVIVKREGPAEEAEDRLRRVEERQEQQEARQNKQERRLDGNDTPFR